MAVKDYLISVKDYSNKLCGVKNKNSVLLSTEKMTLFKTFCRQISVYYQEKMNKFCCILLKTGYVEE